MSPARHFAFLLLLPALAPACTYTLKQSVAPGSAILVYRNGLLQKPGLDYLIAGRTISHLFYEPTDLMAYVYQRIVAYSYTENGQTIRTRQFAFVREDATCSGSSSSQPVALERLICSGSGDSLDANGQKTPFVDPSTGLQKKDANGNPMWVQRDCAGLEFFRLSNGPVVRMYYGIPAPQQPEGVGVVWTRTPLQ